MNDSVFLIVSRRFRPGMSETQIYNIARGDWGLVNPQSIKYALAVVRSEVVGVFEIGGWKRTGNKWKFSGKSASSNIKCRCIGRRTKRSYGYSFHYGNLKKFMEKKSP